MRDYDPWVSELLADAVHKAELRHVAAAQLARQALAGRAARPSKLSARRARGYLQHLVSGFTGYWRPVFRRRVTKAPEPSGAGLAGHQRHGIEP